MFEADLLEEEIKKKKRRVLAVLFGLLLLGAAVGLPLSGMLPPPPTPVPEAAQATPVHTATAVQPTPIPAGTPTGISTPGEVVTPAAPSDGTPGHTPSTPQRTPLATGPGVTPTATAEAPGGGSGGAVDVSPSPPGTPDRAGPTPAQAKPRSIPPIPANHEIHFIPRASKPSTGTPPALRIARIRCARTTPGTASAAR